MNVLLYFGLIWGFYFQIKESLEIGMFSVPKQSNKNPLVIDDLMNSYDFVKINYKGINWQLDIN